MYLNIYYILSCALADGILRTGHFARAKWCLGLSAGDPGSTPGRVLPRDRGPAGASAWPGKGGSWAIHDTAVLLGSADLPPGLFSAPFSRGRRGNCISHLLRSSRFVALDILLSAKRQSEEEKGLERSGVPRRCPWTLFAITISGGKRGE